MALVSVSMSGCGGDDDKSSTRATESETADRLDDRVRRLEKAVPTAAKSGQSVAKYRTTRRTIRTMDDFLIDVIEDVDRYWVRVFAESGFTEPQVTYNWLAPGEVAQMACGGGKATSDDTAAYCPADDTIYVSQQFAYNLWRGIVRGQQGVTYPGDFGVALVVAHEYAHNIQTELGIGQRLAEEIARPYELQADCFAGTWANSEYYEGRLEAGDPEEAIQTAADLGDLDFLSPTHHGTPEERADAWARGYNGGNPDDCVF